MKGSGTKNTLASSGTQGPFGICFVRPHSNHNDTEHRFCSPGCESLNKFFSPLYLFIYLKKFLSRCINSSRSQKLHIVSTETKTVIKTLSVREMEVSEGGAWFFEIIFQVITLNVKPSTTVLTKSFMCF